MKQAPWRYLILLIFFIFAWTSNAISQTYIVGEHESLSEIARKQFHGDLYGRNGILQQLLELNPQITDPNKLLVGQIINLPARENENLIQPTSNLDIYVIKKDETLSEIARKNFHGPLYGKDGALQHLLELNPQLAATNSLLPGQKLRMNDSAPAIAQFRFPQSAELAAESKIQIPTASPPPEAPEKEPEKREATTWSRVILAPTFSYLSISSTDAVSGARARFSTDASTGIQLQWEQYWSKHLTTYQNISYHQWTFLAPAASSGAILQKSPTTSGLAIGAISSIGRSAYLRTFVQNEQQLFISAASSNSYVFYKAFVPHLGISLGSLNQDFRPFLISFEAGYSYLMPANDNGLQLSSGASYFSTLQLQQDTRWGRIGWGLSYSQTSQSSQDSLQNFNQVDVILSIGGIP